MSPALANDYASGFVAFLVVLLAVMLAAVICMPGRDSLPSSEEEDAGPQPAAAAPADVQARAAATITRAAVLLPARRTPGPQPGDTSIAPQPAGQRSRARHAARHASAGTILRPKMPGRPLLGAQAPRHAAGHQRRS